MKESVILVNSQFLGKGDDVLGEGLLETFFTLLKQTNELQRLFFR